MKHLFKAIFLLSLIANSLLVSDLHADAKAEVLSIHWAPPESERANEEKLHGADTLGRNLNSILFGGDNLDVALKFNYPANEKTCLVSVKVFFLKKDKVIEMKKLAKVQKKDLKKGANVIRVNGFPLHTAFDSLPNAGEDITAVRFEVKLSAKNSKDQNFEKTLTIQ